VTTLRSVRRDMGGSVVLGRPAASGSRPAMARAGLPARQASKISRVGLARVSRSRFSRSLIRPSSQASAEPRRLRLSEVTDGSDRSRTPVSSVGKRVGVVPPCAKHHVQPTRTLAAIKPTAPDTRPAGHLRARFRWSGACAATLSGAVNVSAALQTSRLFESHAGSHACRPPAAWDRHFASGMGPGRARFSVAVVDDYGWFGGGSSVACLPVAWDQGQLSAGQPACEARGGAGRCIFSAGHLWAGPGSPGPQGFARRAERSEPLRSRGFWGRLCCPAGKMPLRWFASSRIFEGGPGVREQRPRGSVAGGMVSRPAARWLVFAGAGRTRRRGRARRRRTGAGRWRTGRAGGRPSGRAIRRARGWRW